MSQWVRTNKARRCPICDKPDWCSVSGDGALVHCMRTPSDWPCSNGGWFHRLSDPKPIAPARKWTDTPRDVLDVPGLMARWRRYTTPDGIERMAQRLGVSASALDRLSAAWATEHGGWAFPMTGDAARWCGIRLRNEDGAKWAVRGSRSGLFVPNHLRKESPLFVVEGPTEVAAVLTWGLDAIGRPSCNDGNKLLAAFVRDWPQDVVILSNLDEAKSRPDGSVFYPGQEGAALLADQLRRHRRKLVVMCPPPPFKDARQWLNGGGVVDDVLAIMGSKRDWRVAR